ncbi:putative signal peptide protein [Puccinia sorghi]|uniref:Putative signal peptide protein n=1 Tax=Puccinia sorghi TaxID=27349 RepID=A0A0L6VQE2_9BASI|nr:putative signal peptide protein [Puccinia sorghi]
MFMHLINALCVIWGVRRPSTGVSERHKWPQN